MGIEINVPALLDQIVRRKAQNGAGRHRLLLKVAQQRQRHSLCLFSVVLLARARRAGCRSSYVISKFDAYPFYFLLLLRSDMMCQSPPTELNTPTASPTIPQQIDIAGTAGLFTDWYVQI